MSRVLHWVALVASVMLLSGCISQRGIATLNEVPGAAERLAGLQFRIAAVEAKGAHPGTATNVDGLQGLMARDYPQLFTGEPDAIPLVVRFQAESDQQMLGAILTGLTLGVVPLPAHTGFKAELGVTPWSGTGGVVPESVVRYGRRDYGWMTIFTPLGLIPIPGRSDMERDSSLLLAGGDVGMVEYAKKQAAFSDRTLQKAMLSALAGLDQAALRRYAAERKAMPVFSVDIDGRRYETRLLPAYSKDMRQSGGADQYLLHMRTVDVAGKATTYRPLVARRDAGGDWQVLRPYLLFASRPTVATALLEDGVPARGLVLPVQAPPLLDFIERPEVDGQEAAWVVRWSNGILLQIKNSTLAGELRGRSLPQLQELMTRLESALLDLNERVGRANDRAQQAIEKGENPEAQRELAVVYRQRGEIMKAILGMVRQQAAGAP